MRSISPYKPVGGSPTGAPSTASMVSVVMPSARNGLARCRPDSMKKQPMRLPMKLTVSLACTTPLPRRSAPKRAKASITSGSVSSPGTSSNSFITRTGLKKWVIATSRRNRSLMPSEIWLRGMPEVFDEMTEPSLRAASSRSNSSRLAARSSMTASHTQS